ncbi:aminoacyl-tRNA hydrolase [Levilactobacillus brevis]|jgi:PTH1 family peptidyl-tRNA hydrolase|uniref:Peptidyl-tRNA hydrolase n=2 Tax=Levilactobacillus brevis TaxID=1580 RepID=PTH_LEVBA|nr:aminoacyl-tRNA hydrolase [Levilactobacillus brevis]Q03SZ9.1 RecName: Full=Peptidyl-tRNA hydrolase; Short=PTH [Levilactobacillus brevis ATCC 367]MBL3537748.1 aminoacyl-tRNA hydrolase [Lactobacillus sp. GPR40-2]MBL3630906.1 aminoacyl-tRNA hydrolase [Lactobacillus sp. GPB7-4]ABJ63673.1 peptidyl-tRNA hydrolase [Levilactobacillus brevis ATCC 367]ARQ93418.1 aminoacyl-tRNA hydrolase [Levilactobacillus brevis]ARW21439.1 Aminoacyl-tRNA hydrolase [Levilactobacillus brevis]
MKMIVGLGNIGPQYDNTRHNTGFMVVDAFAQQHGIALTTRKMDARFGSGLVNGEKVLVVKPTTFMNESGRAVHPIMDYFKIDVADVMVVQDDMDLPLGRIRLRDHGSAGGHNGIKSIIAHVGTQNFGRLKVGIAHPQQHTVVDYVLGKFTTDQRPVFNQAADRAVAALDDWVAGSDFMQLMNQYN